MGEADLPIRVGDVLRHGPPVPHALEMGRLWSGWREVVGDAVADHIEPSSLRDGVLRVRAESPAWATEIGYMRGEIQQRVNAYLGAEVVAEVRVWTGPGRGRRRPDPRPRRSESQATGRAPATDPREAFARAREAWHRRRGAGPHEGRSRALRDGKNPW